MSTAAVAPGIEHAPGIGHGPGTEHSRNVEHSPHRGRSLALVEDVCFECGGALAESEEHVCADCCDLRAHAWCRDCGAILADADLGSGACADCTA
ncbi:hypothetical protein SCMU_08300 [Sinomonas cyclohexanicum]|uniref:Double zinc ribbon n=1 Tax=Sinomonas cyclohexanicum TaxID=322009 RepID=A0ABM7PSC7_SINCY|nr:hypothetical protein [Corynebacterium cyclohexanicum]BCT74988.1 hypothetical protein SCMU_08300 [Corynebacterium cyclohexanicum]